MSTYRVVSEQDKYKVEVSKVEYKVSLARTGGQGAANTTFGGLDVVLDSPQEGDVLTVSSNTITNTARTNLTDGGNF